MCASSWEITSAARFFSASVAVAGSSEQQRLAEEDGAGVLHRAGFEVGHGDEVELAVRVGEAEVVARAARGLRAASSANSREVPLARHVPDADLASDRTAPHRGGSSGPTASAHEIGRELRRRREVHGAGGRRRAAPRARPAPFEITAFCFGGRHRDAEARLEARLVEAREEATGIGRLELRERVAAGRQPSRRRGRAGDRRACR